MAGTLVIDTLKSSTSSPVAFQNTSGTAIGTLCRAWVNFAGASGTINGSFNVSSVTRTSTGVYQVYFTNSLPDANYATAPSSQNVVSNTDSANNLYGFSTGSFYLQHVETNTSTDGGTMTVSVFR
jgi:hypothetical protein